MLTFEISNSAANISPDFVFFLVWQSFPVIYQTPFQQKECYCINVSEISISSNGVWSYVSATY